MLAPPSLVAAPLAAICWLSSSRIALGGKVQMKTRGRVSLALGAVVMQVGTTLACTDTGNFAGSLLPCTDGSCSTTTMTCAQLAAVGGCEKYFGELFDYSASSAAPTCSQQFSFGATTAVAMGCCSTCNVDSLSAKEVDDLITLFKKFDQDGDGSIDQSELKALLHVSGIDATDEQVATVLNDDDTDGDGRIEFSEFVGIVRQDMARHPPTAGGTGRPAGSCVERSTTVAGQTLSCSHYVQLGYTCQVQFCNLAGSGSSERHSAVNLLIYVAWVCCVQALTTTPQFMNVSFSCNQSDTSPQLICMHGHARISTVTAHAPVPTHT